MNSKTSNKLQAPSIKLQTIFKYQIKSKFEILDFRFRICLLFVIWNLLFAFVFALPVPAHAWTQTDWSKGDSQCLWYAADRYDTGVNVVVNNPEGAVSMNDTGLVGYWSFNDASSADIAYDQTSNNNDGTITGATWGTVAEDSAVWGYGLSFDESGNGGNGEDVYVSSVSPNPSTEITAMAWINPTVATDDRAPIIRMDRFYFQHYQDNRLASYWYSWSNPGYHTSTVNSVPTGEWTHVAVTWDQTNGVTFYINGVQDNQISNSGTGDTTNWVRIGREDSSRRFNGAIDEVKIYSCALSADEIAAHADTSIIESLGDNAPRGVLLSSTFDADSPVVWKTIEWNNPSTSTLPYERGDSRLRKDEGNLRALWHFDEGVGLSDKSANNSTVYDESTYSNTGIVIGCKWGDASEDSAVFQSGLSFDGDDDYVDFGAPSVLNFGTSTDFTYSFWMKAPYSIVSADIIFYPVYSGATNFIALREGAFNGIYMRHHNGSNSVDIKPSTDKSSLLTDGDWHHISFVSDRDGNGEVYIDGNLEGAVDISSIFSGTPNYTGISSFKIKGDDDFSGAIDEVAIYSYAKSAAEIWQDARGTQIRLRTQTTSSILDGTGSDSPVGLWHFDDDAASTTADDSSIYDHKGTLYGTGPVWYHWGVFGKCLQFNNTTNDYVGWSDSIGDVQTIEFWMNSDGTDSDILELSDDDTVYISDAGNIEASFEDTIIYINGNSSSTPITAGTWYHVAITTDNPININADELKLGKAGDGYFGGLIDELGLYNKVRTSKQIKIDARDGSPWSPWSPYYKKGDTDDIVLFADDFNDGKTSGWTEKTGFGNWVIDNADGVLKITDLSPAETGIIQADNANWYNYQVETKVKLSATTGRAGVILNWDDTADRGYAALLDANADKLMVFEMDTGGIASLKKSHSFNLDINKWYTLKAQYDGSHIRVYLGDKNYITYNVTDYTYKGYAGLIADNATAYFDDFKVYPIDRYVRYEATLTDNMCNDTTPYLYWVRLSYEETTSDDSIWSRVWQDRYGTHHEGATWAPEDEDSTTSWDVLNCAEISSADTVWCYNLENYDDDRITPFNNPDGGLRVFVETLKTTNYLNLRLGIRKTTAPEYPNEWPESIDDYTWCDWMKFGPPDTADCTLKYTETSGDTVVWQCALSESQISANFSTEGGYVLQSRAVSNDEGTEPDPTNFQPDSTKKDRQDTSIIYMMKDITPPGSSNTSGGWPWNVGASGYQPVADINNDYWIGTGDARLKIEGVQSSDYPDGAEAWYINSENTWINYLSQDDSGILVSVEDKNPDTARSVDDCSGLKEKSSSDSPTRYVYSTDGGINWNETTPIPDIDDWSECDTDYDAANDIRYLALGNSKYITPAESYSYLMPNLGPNSTKGENVLIQFAQKDKAGNWGYSHPAYSSYQACSSAGYYINYDITKPEVEITAGPREANYSTSASFEFQDSAEDDSCAFRYLLEFGNDKSTPANQGEYRALTSYQPWLPTSRDGSATYTDLGTADPNWYQCTIGAKDEALNESEDSAVYVFQCLAPVPNTIIYSGPAGIITNDDDTYDAVFKFRGEGGSTTPYKFSYSIDGSEWSTFGETSSYSKTLGYGNHAFRVKAANGVASPDSDDEDPTPACVTFTIENPDKPSAIAPPSDPVKYWREESE